MNDLLLVFSFVCVFGAGFSLGFTFKTMKKQM